MAISAQWNTGSGNWFNAGSWDVDNPDPPPPPPLHYVPGADNLVKIPDNSGVGTPFTITYNGTSSVYAIQGSDNCTLNITGGSLQVLHGGFGIGRINVAAGATLRVDDDTTNFWFSSGDINGTLSGDGVLRFVNGTFNINAGASITVDNWWLTYQIGSGTVSTTELNTNLTYANNFQLVDVFGNYPILNLNGNTLTLSGTALLDGQVHDAGTVRVTGTGSVAGGFFADGAMLRVSGSLQQVGTWALGNGTLQIDSGGTYSITTASDINIAFSSTSTIVNNGSLSDTAAGISRINGDLTNNGTLTAGTGANLSLQSGTQTLNGTINGAGTLTFGFAHNVILNTTTLSVGNLVVAGGNGGGTVTLARNISYGGNFTLADTGVFDLAGYTFSLNGASTLQSGNVDGLGTLQIGAAGTATIGGGGFSLGVGAGNTSAAANAVTLRNSGTVNQVAGVSVNGTILNDAGHAYTITTASNITGIGATGLTFTNNGTFGVTGAGTSTVSGNFTNSSTGTISVAAGATLNLNAGTQTLNGTIAGAGTLIFGFGHNASLNTTTLDVATIYINGGNGGGTLSLARNISYGGSFTFENGFGTLDLNGYTLTLSGTTALKAGSIDGSGTLRVTGTATLGGVAIGDSAGGGLGSAATLRNSGSITQNAGISVHGTILNDAGKTYQLVAANIDNNNGGLFTNAGKLNVQRTITATDSTISADLTNTGTLNVASGVNLRLTGTSDLGGTVTGNGNLILGGTATVNTAITTAALAFNGTTTLGVDLTYGGNFSIGAFGTTNLGGHTLTLSGISTLTSGYNAINGAGTLRITGSSTIGGVSFGNTAPAITVRNSGSIDLTGGISLNGTLLNDAGKTMLMEAGSNISNLGSGGTFTNNGVLTKVAGSGASTISTAFTNVGTLTVATGSSLQLSGTSTLGGTITGGGALILSGTAAVNTAIGASTLAFNGVTSLGTNLTYGGNFSIGGFSTTNLNGRTLTLSGTSTLTSGYNAVNGDGTLRITGSSTIGGVAFGNTAPAVTLRNSGSIDLVGGISLNGTLLNDAGAAILMSAASNITNLGVNGGIVTNDGTFTKDGDTGTGTISTLFTNNGTVVVLEGTLDFQNFVNVGVIQGTLTQSGNHYTVSADAVGQLTLTGGTGDNRLVATIAPTHADGGAGTDTLVIAANMAIAAGSLVSIETIEVANGVTADLSALTTGMNITLASTAGGGSTVFGTKGADTITSGAGIDAMHGGLGNDSYFVDNSGDLVFGAGHRHGLRPYLLRHVVCPYLYALQAGQSVETLRASSVASTVAMNLTGNELAQTLLGNAGANILDGGGGGDRMTGYGGDDTYVINSSSDLVFEAAGQGNDTVNSRVSHVLAAGQSVEISNSPAYPAPAI